MKDKYKGDICNHVIFLPTFETHVLPLYPSRNQYPYPFRPEVINNDHVIQRLSHVETFGGRKGLLGESRYSSCTYIYMYMRSTSLETSWSFT